MARLRPMPADAMPLWIRRSADEYARDLVAGVRGAAESRREAEDWARSQGAHSLGLSVFAANAAARHPYGSLGYETTPLRVRKPLHQPWRADS